MIRGTSECHVNELALTAALTTLESEPLNAAQHIVISSVPSVPESEHAC